MPNVQSVMINYTTNDFLLNYNLYMHRFLIQQNLLNTKLVPY